MRFVFVVVRAVGCCILGAALGALSGGAVVVMLSLPAFSDWPENYLLVPIWMGLLAGAPLGAVAGPLLGLWLLRTAPRSTTILITTIGTTGGSLLGFAIDLLLRGPRDEHAVFFLIGGGIIGLAFAVVGVRRHS